MSTATRLQEAEEARHELLLGQAAIVVQENGTKIEYQPADLPKLERYIETLRQELGQSKRQGPRGFRA